MYLQVGECGVEELLASVDPSRITWNPPGWGSYDLEPTGSWKRVMLMGIKPCGHIPFHTDRMDEQWQSRYHIVLQTNPQSWTYHDGTWQQLNMGGIYQMDPRKEHAAINLGSTVRLHLVVDL